jgi:hypothetical protein
VYVIRVGEHKERVFFGVAIRACELGDGFELPRGN